MSEMPHYNPEPESKPKEVTVERAVPGDAETMCDIRDRGWLESYTNESLGITRDKVLLNAKGPNGEFVPRRIAHIQREIAAQDGVTAATFVGKVGGKVAGYMSPHTDEEGRRRLGAMYVDPEYQGTGLGGKLIRHTLEWYGRDKNIYVEVVSYNEKAIGFYEHFGFEKINDAVSEEEGRPDYMTSIPQITMVLRAESKE